MTEREMLELAAKAAGYRIQVSSSGKSFSIDIDQYWRGWNPLTNDGDALRLAVRLGIHIRHWVYACEAEDNDGRSTGMIHAREFNGDMGAATRRAIVRAAAAIGESMP